MNVELTRIAQKKLDQMGATVHGVLVKNQAGAWAAVSEAGRVMWLDGFEGQTATDREDALDCALSGQSGGVVAFGSGDKTVEVGAYYDKPAVFVAPAEPEGIPGELAPPTTDDDKHRLVPGEWLMTFPTEEQAHEVADALCGRPLKKLNVKTPMASKHAKETAHQMREIANSLCRGYAIEPTDSDAVKALDDAAKILTHPHTNQLDSGAALECPYACGWEALRSIITKNAAYFARATMDDEVPEPVRQAGIAGNQYAIELCRAAMSAPAPQPEGDGWISVGERWPDKTGHYCVALSDPDDIGWSTLVSWTAFWNGDGFEDCDPVEDGQPVTHWMPMPQPPQQGGTE